MWLKALLTFTALYVIQKIVIFRRMASSVGNIPGYRTLVNSSTGLATFLPRLPFPGIWQGKNYPMKDKHSVYAWAGCDIVSHVGLFPSKVDIVLADAGAIKEVTINRAKFPKPVEIYGTLSIYGYNIVASEGDQWKRYRKITAPTFSDRNNKLVWKETCAIMNDLFDSVWGDKDSISLDHCLDLTLPIALFVIGAAGFGRRMKWKEETSIPSGHEMTFKYAISTVLKYLIIKIVLPNWIMRLSKKGREINLAIEELRDYMSEMVEERTKSDKVERHDLFSTLLEASNDIDEVALSNDELIGNIFIFLLAGHETTAHTLCYALALLALYPDEQEKMYQHIKSVIRNPQEPTYEEIPLLTQTMAVFNETLRMYPSVTIIPKKSAEDTTLKTTNHQGETIVVPIPKGTPIMIDAPGLHYNPKYWEDPESFRPDRFLKSDWNKDAFIPFSVGPRACLGRKFGEVEGVTVLTMLVSRYKITVKEEPQFAYETLEQRRKRVLKSTPTLTLRPVRVPLTFTRRK